MPSPIIRPRFTIDGLDFRRLEIRLGHPDADTNHRIALYLFELIDAKDIVKLKQVKEGGFKALHQLFDAHEQNGAPLLSAIRSPLAKDLEQWLHNGPRNKSGVPLKPHTVDGYRDHFKRLLKYSDDDSTTADLLSYLSRYWKHCMEKGQNFRYRGAKTACRSFARSMGKGNPLYAELANAETMGAQRKRERKSAITPREARQIMARMEEQGNGHLTQHIWNLIGTAARPAEYIANWTIQEERGAVFIDGTKTVAAKRFVPLIPNVMDPPNKLRAKTSRRGRVTTLGRQEEYAETTLGKAFRSAAPDKQIYDLRASGMTWWRRSGIDGVMRKIYAGHADSQTHDRYQQMGVDFEDWREDLERDRQLLAKWLEKQLAK